MTDKTINYNDIDTRINILYDFYYNKKNTKKCYEFKPIYIKNIKLEDIKMEGINKSALEADYKYLMKDDNDYYFIRKSNTTYPSLLKIGKYNKDNTHFNDKKRGEMVDMTFNYILSDLVKDEEGQFIKLPLMYFDITFDQLKSNNKDISKKIENVKGSDMLYFKLYELFTPSMTLKEYLDKEGDKDLKSIIFQVLYALFKITSRYPKFRHNKLDLTSIHIVETNKKNRRYTVRGNKYVLMLNLIYYV
jgi:hypothetical protein